MRVKVFEGGIGPYSVKARLGKPEELVDEEGNKLAGCYCRDEQQRWVILAGDMDPVEFFDTLLHELEHAINKIYGLEEDHANLHVRATALAQWLIESGLIDPERVRCAFGK